MVAYFITDWKQVAQRFCYRSGPKNWYSTGMDMNFVCFFHFLNYLLPNDLSHFEQLIFVPISVDFFMFL